MGENKQIDAVREIWDRYIDISNFLRFEFRESLDSLVSLGPESFQVVFDVHKHIIDVRALLPNSYFYLTESSISSKLIPDLNAFLRSCNGLIDARTGKSAVTPERALAEVNKSYENILSRLNDSLGNIKVEMDRILGEKSSSPVVISGLYAPKLERVGRDLRYHSPEINTNNNGNFYLQNSTGVDELFREIKRELTLLTEAQRQGSGVNVNAAVSEIEKIQESNVLDAKRSRQTVENVIDFSKNFGDAGNKLAELAGRLLAFF